MSVEEYILAQIIRGISGQNGKSTLTPAASNAIKTPASHFISTDERKMCALRALSSADNPRLARQMCCAAKSMDFI